MVTWPPRTWTISEVVTAVKMNEIRDQLRYLKGMDEPIVLEDALRAPNVAVNVSSPTARFHVQEDADSYAGIVENVRSTGVPNGLLVAVDNAGSSVELLTVAKGVSSGSLDKKFVVYGDGNAQSQGHDIFHTPSIVTGFGGSSISVTTTPTVLTNCFVTVEELGYYWVQGLFHLGANLAGGDVGRTLTGQIYYDGSPVGQTVTFKVPSSGNDIVRLGMTHVQQHTSGSKNIDLRVWKSAGTADGGTVAYGHLTVLWIAPN